MNATAGLLNDLVCLKLHVRRLPGDIAEMIPNDDEEAVINQMGQSCFGACYKTKEQASSLSDLGRRKRKSVPARPVFAEFESP